MIRLCAFLSLMVMLSLSLLLQQLLDDDLVAGLLYQLLDAALLLERICSSCVRRHALIQLLMRR